MSRSSLSIGSFQRFYLILAVILVVAGAMAMTGRVVIEQVRLEQYREDLAQAPMRWLSERLADLEPAQRDEWLAGMARELDIEIRLSPLRERDYGFFDRQRLQSGRVLVSRVAGGWRLTQGLVDESRVIEAWFNGFDERQLGRVIHHMGSWLADGDAGQRPQRVARLQAANLPVTLTSQPPAGLEESQLTELASGEPLIQLISRQGGLTVYQQVITPAGLPRWLLVGPFASFEPMPWSLHLLLMLFILGISAFPIYLVMSALEARMARLELAASRIAAGRLDTRVKVESGDFLGRLGMAFNGMAAQVQSLLRAQQDMIRAVSHELRTPVARIRFAMQMVEDMTDDPAVRRQLEGIDGDIEELDGLIDEILTYARLGSEAINGQEMSASLVDCQAMAQRVIEALRPLHGHLSIELADGGEVEVDAEPRYLQRALQNLVANACRHAKSRVVIRLYGEPRLVRMDVEDDGPGVPVGERLEVFKPFARLDDSRARRSGGYGLGLSIVQKVMTWHGGSVAVDDSPELGGARFTLLLPRRPVMPA
ncbi:two-component system, OmpR family, sensor histidine kinase RstB [Halomonas korlensis]|uniref:histidine kinase n=1 Tax=Halomonas korlensis TaxID=463301 RepID=A0A1I7I545_9GAMM|nr:ATP-binding protein [Halomonas korlensis]SFU68080.1 two-component system, OmpR family, sensor histidine kinase RstB [Halomonas korlensis]